MCDLKHVLYFSDRHGALVSGQQKFEEIYVSGICPGQAIADTGCRTAVGGGAWHESLQKELKARGLQWLEEPEQEVFSLEQERLAAVTGHTFTRWASSG